MNKVLGITQFMSLLEKSIKRYLTYLNKNYSKKKDLVVLNLLCEPDPIENKKKIKNAEAFYIFITSERLPWGDYKGSPFRMNKMLIDYLDSLNAGRCINYKNFKDELKIFRFKPNDKNIKEEIEESIENSLEIINKEICNHPFSSEDYKEKLFKELSRLYAQDDFFQSEHENYGKLEEQICDEKIPPGSIKDTIQKIRQNEIIYDLAKNFSLDLRGLRKNEKKAIKILIIDDNPGKIKDKLLDSLRYFDTDIEIHLTKDYKKFLSLNMQSDIEYQILKSQNGQSYNSKDTQKIKFILDEADFVLVDLLLGGENVGHRVIRNLIRFRKSHPDFEMKYLFDILVLSRSTDATDIQRCLNEGAVGYIYKSRIYSIPYHIGRLFVSSEESLRKLRSTGKSQNFRKLYKLPDIYIRRLRTEKLLPENDRASEKQAYDWIHDIPKAELHCHLGGSLRADVVFYLALNFLSYFWKVIGKEKKELTKRKKENICRKIICYMEPFIKDPFIIVENREFINKCKDETGFISISGYSKNNSLEYHVMQRTTFQLFCDLFLGKGEIEHFNSWICKNFKDVRCGNDGKEVFLISFFDVLKEWLVSNKKSWVFERLKTKELKSEDIIPEVLVFSYLLENIQEEIDKLFKKRIIFREYQLKCFYIVLLGILEGRNSRDVDKLLNKKIAKSPFYEIIIYLEKQDKKNKRSKIEIKKEELKDELQLLRNILNSNLRSKKRDVIKELISADNHTKQNTLVGYLRGCEYTGAELLQIEENIKIAVASIVEEAAKENVRYIEIRCAPHGFIEFGLTVERSIRALFEGTDIITRALFRSGKYIRSNLIFTGKRHKTVEDLALQVASMLVFRDYLSPIRYDLELNKRKKSLLPGERELLNNGYEWHACKLVGFDLAGPEAHYKAKEFEDSFLPLFQSCVQLTIHAGEADTAESIWEAIYKLRANRIGHGLTLIQNLKLLNLIRDRKITLELCPKSNRLTNFKYKDEIDKNVESTYPLKNYYKNGLQVTLNTDNRSVSDSTLSQEFLEVAKYFWPEMTKWEAIRIIKMGFKNAFLSKDEIRQLLKAVDEEVYERILRLEIIEPE